MTKRLDKKISSRALINLMKEDPIAAEVDFNALSAEHQVALFLGAGDEERLRFVEMSHAPTDLLAGIPATELWFTIKRLGPRDALSLIKYSTPEQLQVICDIEWWKKDRLDDASMYEWLEYIVDCGMDKVMEWFKECDWDQIQWFFKENIVVYKMEDKDDDPTTAIQWPREEAPTTHEGVYYFQVVVESRDQLIRYLMEILAKHDLELYHKICESALWEIPSEKEEQAYEVKSRRLAEHGFPSFDEAISVYSPLDKKRFALAPKRPQDEEVDVVPMYPLTVMDDAVLFINRVFTELSGEAEGRFLMETASIANKLLVADGYEISSENLSASLVKAIGYINIGLETLSEGDVSKAASLMNDHWTISIFQVGLAEVVKLSSDAGKVFKKSWMNGDIDNLVLLEPHQKILITNLLSKRPKYYTGSDEFAVDSIRDFTTIKELKSAKEAMFVAEFVGRLVENLFVKEIGNVFQMVNNVSDLRFTGIFLTAFVNGYKDGLWQFKPVHSQDIQDVLKKINISDGEALLSEGFKNFRGWMLSREKGLTSEERISLDDILNLSKERFVDEFKGMNSLPEPRFIHSVWTV